MIYTPLTRKAMKLCFDAHKGALDKGGFPYVFHPFHVAEQMTDEYSVCVALLHDVFEDTDIPFSTAEKEFPGEVVDALKCITHKKGEDYFDYIRRVKQNDIAKRVKLADLRHNMDTSRLDPVDEKALQHIDKYTKALRILSE
ncbi:MAG: GTP pyrophosphokinase [Eubacterium sp.]|jgi:(p)ppGpp synthase/HD superfamily hydrolase